MMKFLSLNDSLDSKSASLAFLQAETLVFIPNIFHLADVQLYKVAILGRRNMACTVRASLIGSRVLPLSLSHIRPSCWARTRLCGDVHVTPKGENLMS